METKRDILLINSGDCGVSLADSSEKFYTIKEGSRIRVSENTLREIVDYTPSRDLLLQGYITIEGATYDTFYDCGLTDDEIDILIGNNKEIEEEEVEGSVDEIVDSMIEIPEVVALTYHNWLKNKKYDKIKESLGNPLNVDTLKGILKKKKEYNTDEVKKILSEVE